VTDHKTILMTGAGSGLGRLVALALGALGHTVLAGCQIRPQVTDLLDMAELHDAGPLDVRPFRLDLTRTDDINQAGLLAEQHRVDVLFNNAGIIEAGVLGSVPVSLMREVFDVNVFGTYALTRAVLPTFLARRDGSRDAPRGRLVFMSSISGLIPVEQMGAYAASKRAIEGIAETIHVERIDQGISVAVINPGLLDTGFDRAAIAARDLRHRNPLDEPGPASDDPHLRGATDPAEVIAPICHIVTGEAHGFRHVVPYSLAERIRKHHASFWDW